MLGKFYGIHSIGYILLGKLNENISIFLLLDIAEKTDETKQVSCRTSVRTRTKALCLVARLIAGTGEDGASGGAGRELQ